MKRVKLQKINAGKYLGYEYILDKVQSTDINENEIEYLNTMLDKLISLEERDDSYEAHEVSMHADSLKSALGEYLISDE